MENKKKQIIESAVKLFATNGFHLTSMQEVANQIGVSKGSLYIHFSSKEELLLSIMDFYQEKILEKIAIVANDPSLSPREKLIKQVYVQFSEFHRNGDFIKLHVKEQLNHNSQVVKEHMLYARARRLHWEKNALLLAYGEDLRPYLWDVVIIFHSIVGEYMKLLVFDEVEFDIAHAAKFIVQRIESMVEGILATQPDTVITLGMMNHMEKFELNELLSTEERVTDKIIQLNDKLKNVSLSSEKIEELSSSIQFLQKELLEKEPRKFIVKSILKFLEDTKEIAEEMNELKALVFALLKEV